MLWVTFNFREPIKVKGNVISKLSLKISKRLQTDDLLNVGNKIPDIKPDQTWQVWKQVARKNFDFATAIWIVTVMIMNSRCSR